MVQEFGVKLNEAEGKEGGKEKKVEKTKLQGLLLESVGPPAGTSTQTF